MLLSIKAIDGANEGLVESYRGGGCMSLCLWFDSMGYGIKRWRRGCDEVRRYA